MRQHLGGSQVIQAPKGKTFGIFEMKDAHSMRTCYDLSGTEFPKEFNAPKGTQFYLVGYRRQSDSTPATPERKQEHHAIQSRHHFRIPGGASVRPTRRLE